MRASLYSDALLEAICARLEVGETMADICRSEGMPAYRTVKDWIDTKPQVSAAIARAREIGFDRIAAQCLTIADGPEAAQRSEYGSDDVQRDKLRIWSRLQLLAKWDPKRYGDKTSLEHTGPNGGPVQTVTSFKLADLE